MASPISVTCQVSAGGELESGTEQASRQESPCVRAGLGSAREIDTLEDSASRDLLNSPEDFYLTRIGSQGHTPRAAASTLRNITQSGNNIHTNLLTLQLGDFDRVVYDFWINVRAIYLFAEHVGILLDLHLCPLDKG